MKLALLTFATATVLSAAWAQTGKTELPPPRSVTMVQLLKKPESFNRQRIRVIGILNLEFEGTALYLRPADLIRPNRTNGFWLDIPQETRLARRVLHGKLVAVDGIFNITNTGHGGLYRAGISEITDLQLWNGPMPSTLEWK